MDKKAKLIHVAKSKSGHTRAIPIGVAVGQVLDGQVRHVRSPYVFTDTTGKHFSQRARRNNVGRRTGASMRAAGIDDASFHSLRHTAASWMVQAGRPILEVSKILGHGSIRMTEVYAHLAPTAFEADYDRIKVSVPLAGPSAKVVSLAKKSMAKQRRVAAGKDA